MPIRSLLAAALAALPAVAQAQDPAAHPAQTMQDAAAVFAAGKREEGTYLFYVAQLRWRARLLANPNPSGEGAAFGALFETVGPPINEWAFGDIPALAAIMDRALAWDAAHPDPVAPEPARAESRAGLTSLRDQILAEEPSIRAQREANGLPNR